MEVYGTLIDWETGIYRAFQEEASEDGFTIDRDQLIPLFLETQREIMAGSYELYAEVLRRTAVTCASELGWEIEPVRSSFLPNSIPSWPPFRDTNALLERLKKKYEIGLIAIDREAVLLGLFLEGSVDAGLPVDQGSIDLHADERDVLR